MPGETLYTARIVGLGTLTHQRGEMLLIISPTKAIQAFFQGPEGEENSERVDRSGRNEQGTSLPFRRDHPRHLPPKIRTAILSLRGNEQITAVSYFWRDPDRIEIALVHVPRLHNVDAAYVRRIARKVSFFLSKASLER